MRLIAATNDTEYGRTEIGTSMRTASMIVHRKPLKFESDPHLRKRGLKMPFRLAVTASDRLPLALAVCIGDLERRPLHVVTVQESYDDAERWPRVIGGSVTSIHSREPGVLEIKPSNWIFHLNTTQKRFRASRTIHDERERPAPTAGSGCSHLPLGTVVIIYFHRNPRARPSRPTAEACPPTMLFYFNQKKDSHAGTCGSGRKASHSTTDAAPRAPVDRETVSELTGT
ncbi:hypothetical protein EVAR_37121_1 [Eumeta japonica]|uniref:Uncharacterized protein n=1 Tax=Eumeta variegata TaxID=151549 RepID=A0A4C1XQE5_EUMVA|nr:hypothetical protein EVAR_37121_1 [Eumeta japonica]